jgi:hypothetical protein
MNKPPLQGRKIAGLRADSFGDPIFIDHADVLKSGVKRTLCLLSLMVPRHLSQLSHHARKTVTILSNA